MKHKLFSILVLGLMATPMMAQATYWSLFNIEGESSQTAQYVTYATLTDMLGDTNRLSNFSPNSIGFGRNIVGSGSDGTNYWNLFNIEGESSQTAQYVTYATLTDMLGDTNRLGNFSPNAIGFGRNIVGSGSDGTNYWNLFNIEGESSQTAQYVTYATLTDMLGDTNRLSNFSPNSIGFGRNIVGSGSDGTNYWNLFNIEGESSQTAQYVTYATLTDMLGDTNRLSNFSPNSIGFGRNIVGSGSDEMAQVTTVPEPGTLVFFGIGIAGLGFARRRSTPNPKKEM